MAAQIGGKLKLKNVRDHEATTRIIEYLEANSEVSANMDELRIAKKSIFVNADALKKDIENTRKQVEGQLRLVF
jgi:hypothetical protein